MSTTAIKNPFLNIADNNTRKAETKTEKYLKISKRCNAASVVTFITSLVGAGLCFTPIGLGAKIASGAVAATALVATALLKIGKDEFSNAHKMATVGPEIIPAKDLRKAKDGFYQKTADGNYAKMV